MLLAAWTWSYVYGTAQLIEECVLRARAERKESYFSATMNTCRFLILVCSQTSESLSVLLRHCLLASYKAIGHVNKPTSFRVLEICQVTLATADGSKRKRASEDVFHAVVVTHFHPQTRTAKEKNT